MSLLSGSWSQHEALFVCVFAVLSEACNVSSPLQLNVSWYLRNSHCYNEVIGLKVTSGLLLEPSSRVRCCSTLDSSAAGR